MPWSQWKEKDGWDGSECSRQKQERKEKDNFFFFLLSDRIM
ncbi:hypothetical protein HanXRQr2_Chr04g0163851 [Helianthus annuus]|uniref:Uncharacterized protein n=1 Tax=Helianthus annuus TaxID=4232 RepID=A0A9K3NSP4_HELAN|nr:hypothetical protein HanXRQr2_Chr04g0163851 [Helianthus annuus]